MSGYRITLVISIAVMNFVFFNSAAAERAPVQAHTLARPAMGGGAAIMHGLPVMGWSSWSFLRLHPTAKAVREQASALVSSGLSKVGYQYVAVDDYWYRCARLKHKYPGVSRAPDVDQYGRWVTNRKEFPDGIKALARYVHHLGLKFGIYITPGISRRALERNTPILGTGYKARDVAFAAQSAVNNGCGGMVPLDFSKPGAAAFIRSEIKLFSSWGVDFIKLDENGRRPRDGYGADVQVWRRAIAESGRRMVLYFTSAPILELRKVLPNISMWGAGPGDIEHKRNYPKDTIYPLTLWPNVAARFNVVSRLARTVSSGVPLYLDSIELGNGTKDGLSRSERESAMALWCMDSSPLFIGADLTHLNSFDLRLLENRDLISIDQHVSAPRRVVNVGGEQAFIKRIAPKTLAVAIFDTSDSPQVFSVPLGLIVPHSMQTGEGQTISISKTILGTARLVGGSIHTRVGVHGVSLLVVRLKPVQ